jgi:translation initiation factor 6
MSISTGDILGHTQIGVYLSVVDKVLFYPRALNDAATEELKSAFDLEMHPFLVGGSSLLGSLLSGNAKGIAVADISDVVVMESGVNAAGNLIECNAHGAVVSPVVPQNGVDMIGEVLGVDAIRSKVAGHDTVGSMLVANGNGVLAHPDVSRSEAKSIESVMKVPVMVGTVTFGSPYVGAGCAASDTHALVGAGSTGPELNRIEDALGLI